MSNNKFCIECGYQLPRTAKFCEECGAKLIVSETNKPETEVTEAVEEVEEEIEEVEERPSYLKKRGKYKPKPKETTGRTMQEAAAEISSEYKQERLDSEERARQERLSSYETENSSKKENTDKKKWYKSGVFIACMIFLFIPIFNEIYRCGGICPTLGTKGLTTIISTPIIVVLIPVGIYRLIRKSLGKIMEGFGLIFTLVFLVHY